MGFFQGLLAWTAIKALLRLLPFAIAGIVIFVLIGPKVDLGSLLPDFGSEDERLGRVTRVIDGDTLEVRIGTRVETVRLIGVDSPETGKPGVRVECGALAAKRLLERLADGERVRLVFDPTQAERDRYDRLLAYVYLEKLTLEEKLLSAGVADVYVYEDTEFELYDRFAAVAAEAKSAGSGSWRECAGVFHSEQ